ncbi:phage virion morphogenesis protein [Deinococcus pimensis]|uniref:phage virion morphogenesis protein n=1 Tax=Deinococcus pimensis TaxID=309888 RepID=UPI00048440EE|nr:phage virion morphogenesis protein [Deinococcus pimensis]
MAANLFTTIERQLRLLTRPQTLADLHNIAGATIAPLVERGFDREEDPYGVPWAPSKAAQREGRKTLTDTGALRRGVRWKADSRALVFSTSGPAQREGYDRVHQYGASWTIHHHPRTNRFISASRARRLRSVVPVTDVVLPARPFLPDRRGMPRLYEARVGAAFRRYLRSRFGGP